MFSRVIVAPPVEPLTLTEVKLDRAVEHSLHDDLLTALIKTARSYVEDYCSLSLVYQTRELLLDGFESIIELPFGPVQSLLTFQYVNTDGVLTDVTATDYVSHVNRYNAVVVPAYSRYFPTPRYEPGAVRLTYTAGYPVAAGSPADYTSGIPPGLKTAMRLLVGNFYENREATSDRPQHEVPLAVSALLGQHRRSWL